ncbi:MAG: hypothetical protein ABI919_00075 [Ramlibacter sp.]
MPTTLHRFLLSGPGHAATRKRLALGLLALVLLAALVAAGRHVRSLQRQDALAREQAFAVSAATMIELCVNGAVLFNDVRWAVVCKALGDRGEGDGFADCDLPDDLASRLYTSLQQDERKCAAEAKAFRVQ